MEADAVRFQHTLVDFANLDGMAEDTAESEAFAEKFKPKKTNDDVYTPPEVYDAVLKWVERTYGLPEDTVVVRPFYPGGNYLTHDYPEGCLVLDNPPFSLMAKIVKFYVANGVRFFLFANTLTLFQQIGLCNAVVCGYTVTYENGAGVNTSFLTSLGEDKVTVSGELYGILDRVQDDGAAPLPKYDFPPNVITAARLTCIAMQGGGAPHKGRPAHQEPGRRERVRGRGADRRRGGTEGGGTEGGDTAQAPPQGRQQARHAEQDERREDGAEDDRRDRATGTARGRARTLNRCSDTSGTSNALQGRPRLKRRRRRSNSFQNGKGWFR